MQRRRPLVPDSERRRVRRACDNCRQNKLKCEGVQPCRRCRSGSRTCFFAGGKPSELQQALPSSSSLSERERILESILQSCGINVPRDLGELKEREQVLLAGNGSDMVQDGDSSRNTREHDVPQESPVIQHADNVIVTMFPLYRPTYMTRGKLISRVFFLLGYFATLRSGQLLEISSHMDTKVSAFRHSVVDCPNSILTDLRPSLLAALPPREVLQFLSDNFFTYTQSNFCIVHPGIFSRKLDYFLQGTHEFSLDISPTRKPIEFVCVLFLVLAMGSQYAGLEQDKPNFTMDRSTVLSASTGLLLHQTPQQLSPNPGSKFYEISRRLLSDVVTSSSMTSVQACLLHAGYLVGTSAHDVAYNMLGLAVRMAINMGMHKPVSSESLHPHVCELRNRLWWSVFTRDRLFTSQIGRPLSISDEEVDTSEPAYVPKLEVKGFPCSVDNQIALIGLCKLLGKIITTIYSSLKSPKSDSGVINTSHFLALRSELQQWRSDLPEALKISPSASRGVFHIHLSYEQTIILLNRLPLIHAAASVDNSTMDQYHSRLPFLQDAAKGCVGAALSTIRILRLLRESKLMCPYTCQDSLYCSSALHVLLLGAKLEPPTQDTKGLIADGVFMLKELACGNETASSALQGIISGFNRLFNKQNSDQNAPSETMAEPASSRESRHRAWQDWMLNSSNPIATGVNTGAPFLTRSGDQIPSRHASAHSPDPFNVHIANAIDLNTLSHGSASLPGGSPADELLSGTSNTGTTLVPIVDAPGSPPMWFRELDRSFSILEEDLGQNMVMGGLNIWETMPTDFCDPYFR